MRKLSILALFVGIGLFVWLLSKIGTAHLWDIARTMGWSFFVLIPLSLIWILPNTKGLAMAVNPDHTSIPFRKLFVIRLVGESVNYMTPSGYLGGEPVKATLMAPQLGMGHALSAVMVAKTAQTLGLLLFIIIGLTIANWKLTLSSTISVAATGAIILLSLGVIAMILVSFNGVASKITEKVLDRYSRFALVRKLHDFMAKMDHSLAAFFREHKSLFCASVLWHLTGWAMGTLEVYVIVSLAGSSISLLNAFLLSSVATLFMVGGFFIPGSLGTFELGHYVAATMVGLPPEMGILISLSRRLREVIWLGIGLALFGIFFRKIFNKKLVEDTAPAREFQATT